MFLRKASTNFLSRIRLSSTIFSASRATATNSSPIPLSGKLKGYYDYGSRGHTWRTNHKDLHLWIILCGQAAILGINAEPVLAEDVSIKSTSENEGDNVIGLHKIEDASVISNEHTSKWRIFTDNGRDFFLQGKLEQAERFFLSAIQEAKEGFGERDPHVASACNNLAELYRLQKQLGKAEPLYLEAIKILEESFGPEDIRVGAALHNLGQLYLIQRKLEEAHKCYKIKGRVLGYGHTDYAETMYHLGVVLYLQGKEEDAEALIQDSIRILEDSGQGESMICIKRLRYLVKIYLKSGHLADVEGSQRKILRIMELSKGWNSMETVIAAEGLALTLLSAGSLKEAQELLERCLDSRKSLLPEDHIQIGANMLHIARVEMLISGHLRKTSSSEAIAELNKAKDHLDSATRVARQVLNKLTKQIGNKQNYGASEEIIRVGRTALVILLQSLDALGLLVITKQELQESSERYSTIPEAEDALFQCLFAYKEFGTESSLSDSPEVKAEYLSCLKHLSSLIGNATADGTPQPRGATLQELKDEIKRVEIEISPQ
ncbi:TPR_10 domain-containing protein/TPR_12 domain-containing protein [Cephalotus follicularis]|uniref:TPR_10 domain-containing protein/TPR_12 domain-containing protein n=1 Tax=Cephalotus follicularis TaxID=3775 RepID=A0A1Q3AXV6_CEPFO|nr:TPR_10 domain-containing protein/TPR_12 domain-containing protein [Cephalotus follicularis]